MKSSSVVALAVVLGIGCQAGMASIEPERLRFHIVTAEERLDMRRILSEATVEGPPGTDFEIALRGARFRMTARFLTDSLVAGAMEVKARLETRRLYGYSERELPLYEEDVQSHDLILGLQERIVLLPFGRPTSDERLAIEITPSRVDPSPSSSAELQIDIVQPSADGSVQIRAFRVAHRFELTASLLSDGVEIARGEGECRIEGSESLKLRPLVGSASDLPKHVRDVTLDVRGVLRERPVDLVEFGYRVGAESGSAITPLGLPLEIELPEGARSESGRKYVLRIQVREVGS